MTQPFSPAAFARTVVTQYVTRGTLPAMPEPIPEAFAGPAGVFVSIKKEGALRGCIGTISPVQRNAIEEIASNAVKAATADPRFAAVSGDELGFLTFSVDVLGSEEPIGSPDALDPANYGVIVRHRNACGLLLPDLPGVDSAAEQVDIALRKAGIHPALPYDLSRFRVTRFHEE